MVRVRMPRSAKRANHDIQRNVVTAHNDKIGRELGFPDQRDFDLAVGVERGGERIDSKESICLRERRHRARALAGRECDEAVIGADQRNQHEFFATELGRYVHRHARSDRVRGFKR